MEDNQTSLTRLQTSLQTEMQSVVQKYGEDYLRFLRAYPTLRKREELITTARRAVREGGMSFAQIDNYFSKGASEWWIKVMLIDLLTFLGAMDSVTSYQVKGIAARIRQEYYHLTPSELTHFFYSFSMGDYGKLYAGRTVNPQDILIGLKEYMYHLYEQRAQYDSDQRKIKQEQELEQSKREAVDFEEYKRLKGLPKDYKTPHEKVKEYIKKHQQESKRK